MTSPDLVVRGRRVVTRDGIRPAAVHIHERRIRAVTAYADVRPGTPIREAGDLLVMPGLVDAHVHVNEPGRADWEGYETATRAAAAGGVTTIVDLPVNSVPATTNVEGLALKRAAAVGRIAVNVAFWGGLVPDNVARLAPLCDAGVRGFACSLVPSALREFPPVDEGDLRQALPLLAERNLPLLVHAELPAPLARGARRAGDPRAYATWMRSRPAEAEVEAIALLARLAAEYRARIHVPRVSSASAIPVVRAARAAGIRLTAGTCPHYLMFTAEEIADGATGFACAPPIRGRTDRDALWKALLDGDLQLVASDHSPCPPALKDSGGDFFKAWPGVAGLELGLAATWTGLSSRGGGVEHLVEWLCAAPARLAGFEGRKGVIAAEADADLLIWDPNASLTVDADRLHHRHKATPYTGLVLRGRVHATIVGGHLVHERGIVDSSHGCLQ